MNRKQPEHDLCERIEQLIGFEDEMLKYKTKFYCEHCLSFGKEYVDKLTDSLYDECENYFKKLNNYEEFEKQFIKSYESNLSLEGKEICKEVDSIIGDKDELMMQKAVTYCNFISHPKKNEFDPNLIDRCRNYRNKIKNYEHFKKTLEKVEYDRKQLKKWYREYDASN